MLLPKQIKKWYLYKSNCSTIGLAKTLTRLDPLPRLSFFTLSNLLYIVQKKRGLVSHQEPSRILNKGKDVGPKTTFFGISC